MLEKIGLDVKFATRPRNTFSIAFKKVLRGLVKKRGYKSVLYQMLDEVGAVAREHVDDRNLDHRVAAGLETH